jgi:hypothetical protein
MKRFMALYHTWSGTDYTRDCMCIYAKDLTQAANKWSAMARQDEQIISLVPNPTAQQYWDEHDERRKARML